LLHGDYGMGDFVNTLAPSAEAKPISNLYIGGHIVLLPAQNTDGIAPPDDQDEHAGALIAGTRDRNNVMNDKFLPAYDARVAELGLTPRQIWAENANVNIKLCYGARYGREMLEQFAERLPEDVTINAYTEPFVWSTSRKYPFGITTNLRHRLGEDNPGLVRIKGKWRPDAGQQASVPGPASDLAGGSSESSVNLGQ
ncbi:MAG: hypothetical protein HY303_10045, partial [Candidatus Wallbacteria bacterium]|nr:hypothetical protein [Candidatus Wallbacteria bacterium]